MAPRRRLRIDADLQVEAAGEVLRIQASGGEITARTESLGGLVRLARATRPPGGRTRSLRELNALLRYSGTTMVVRGGTVRVITIGENARGFLATVLGLKRPAA
jgi:hypothetical protein